MFDEEWGVYIVTHCLGGKNLQRRDLVTPPEPVIRGDMGQWGSGHTPRQGAVGSACARPL